MGEEPVNATLRRRIDATVCTPLHSADNNTQKEPPGEKPGGSVYQ